MEAAHWREPSDRANPLKIQSAGQIIGNAIRELTDEIRGSGCNNHQIYAAGKLDVRSRRIKL